MPTITPDPLNAATPPDNEYVLNIPIEIRALKARVNAAAGLTSDSINYFRKNLLDNGSFQVRQRLNALYTASKVYAAAEKFFFWDRWCFQVTAGFTATLAMNRTASLLASSGFTFGLTTATAAISDRITMYQRVVNARKLAGKTLQLTSHVDIPASVLAAGNFTVKAIWNYGTGGTPAAQVTLLDTTISTAGGVLVTHAITCPAVSNAADFGTNENEYLEIQYSWMFLTGTEVKWRDVQLEEGSKPSPFEVLTYEDELFRCRRHFQRSYAKDSAIGLTGQLAGCARIQPSSTASPAVVNIAFSRTMRAIPTVTLYSTDTPNASGKIYKETATAGDLGGTSTATNISESGFSAVNAGAALTADHVYRFHWTADAEIY